MTVMIIWSSKCLIVQTRKNIAVLCWEELCQEELRIKSGGVAWNILITTRDNLLQEDIFLWHTWQNQGVEETNSGWKSKVRSMLVGEDNEQK